MAGPTQHEWGIRPLLPAMCALGCAAFAIWLAIAVLPEDRLFAGAALCLTILATAALLTMRRRLTAGPDGLMIRGPGGTRRVGWGQVAAISTPTRQRRGLASTSVEVDLDDGGLIVLGRTELGADPVDVAAALQYWWRLGATTAASAAGAVHELGGGDVGAPYGDPGVTDDDRRGDQD